MSLSMLHTLSAPLRSYVTSFLQSQLSQFIADIQLEGKRGLMKDGWISDFEWLRVRFMCLCGDLSANNIFHPA
jgi:hypothetical protein